MNRQEIRVNRGGIFHPDFRPLPFWWEAWRPQAEKPIDLPGKVDVAIIGGGYAGLNAAIELTRGGASAVVLEANELGSGASSRNGGAVSGGVTLGKGLDGGRRTEDSSGLTLAQRLLGGASDSLALVEDIIRRENIACHWERSGRFTGACTRKHYDLLATKMVALNRDAQADCVMLPRERQHEEIASDYYCGGLLTQRSGKLHPALYVKGLIDAARRYGVLLAAHSAVERVDGERGAFTVRTTRGAIAAHDVIVATNGYTGDATPSLKRKIIPVASHIIATEELPDSLAKSLIPRGRTISDTPRVLTYYRMSPDGKRMLFGGRARFTAVTPEISAPTLHRMMVARFPQLRDARVTHAWTGNIAFAFDFLPHMGQERPGLHYCLGCNGSGIAMMSYLGHQTARKILGGGNRVSAYEEIELPGQWGYTGTPWFLPVVGAWYRFLDRVDRALDR
jgi:glycine/D-amino acid oxidase-like deaminating enzyme